MFEHILLSSRLVNNRVIVIENRQKNFQLQLSTFENSKLQLQLQQNCEINCNFINYYYNFSKPGLYCMSQLLAIARTLPSFAK